MNYIKIVEGVAGLIRKKVQVTLFNSVSGEKIGLYKIEEDRIPAIFDRPTLIEIEGKVWRITKVEIIRESSYLFSRKIGIHVIMPSEFHLAGKYLVPTKSFQEIILTEKAVPESCVLDLDESDWRQLEFLPSGSLQSIQEELELIDPLIHPATPINNLLGYDQLHVRKSSFDRSLDINYQKLIEQLQVEEEGSVRIMNAGVVQNGFMIRTSWYTYYGVLEGEEIKQMGLTAFDCVDDEFVTVAASFNLVLADWCNARVVIPISENDEHK